MIHNMYASAAKGISIVGILLILGCAYLFSNNRKAIRSSFIVKALTLQMILAYLILHTSGGKRIFDSLANGFQKVYQFADQGASFVFGSLSDASQPWGWIFGVKVIPIIIFFGALTSLLFHLRIVQYVVHVIALIVRPLLGTTGSETLCAAANSMLGQTEAPLLIKDYLPSMNDSQLLVVMVSGMATLSGSILAVYGGMGVPMSHLLAASVMAIPGSLLIAKMLIPDTEKVVEGDASGIVEPTTKNVLDAISVGTIDGMRLAVNVAAMLIVFISMIALLNYLLGAVTGMIFATPITLDSIFGKLFSSVAYFLGVASQDLETAGALLGKKLVINEFVAYDGLVKATVTERTRAILTYALCGFSNFSCIGIQIGGIGALAPEKRTALTRLGMIALLGGTLTNFLNAAIAALFI